MIDLKLINLKLIVLKMIDFKLITLKFTDLKLIHLKLRHTSEINLSSFVLWTSIETSHRGCTIHSLKVYIFWETTKNIPTFLLCFLHPIFHFWFLVTYGDEVMKIQKYYVISVYIFQRKMGKLEKNRKKIMQLKSTKYKKPKDKNMVRTKH